MTRWVIGVVIWLSWLASSCAHNPTAVRTAEELFWIGIMFVPVP